MPRIAKRKAPDDASAENQLCALMRTPVSLFDASPPRCTFRIHNHWAELEDAWAYGPSTQCQRRQCQSELRPRRPRRHHCQERNGGYCCKNCHARYITGSKPRGNKTNHTDTCKVYMHASCAAREALAQHFNMMYTTSGQPCGSALRRSSSDGWGQDHLRRAYKRMKPRVGRTQQFSFTTVPSAANVPSNGQRSFQRPTANFPGWDVTSGQRSFQLTFRRTRFTHLTAALEHLPFRCPLVQRPTQRHVR